MLFCMERWTNRCSANSLQGSSTQNVLMLSKSLYGLRQAPRAWFNTFVEFVTSIGFKQTRSDSSLFTLRTPVGTAYLLLYVDDMVLSASTTTLLHRLINQLRSAFAVKDMGPLLLCSTSLASTCVATATASSSPRRTMPMISSIVLA
jgi:hypothetical protein